MLFSIFAFTICMTATSMATNTESFFWAYGTGIQALPLFYADGTAYLGNAAPPNTVVATNITLSQNTDDGTFTATPANSSISSGNWTSPKLFIDTASGAFDAAGFTSTTTSSITTTGFRLWGTLLVWVSDSGDIQSKWFAQPIDDDVWVLKWNVDNTVNETVVPVVIKNLQVEAGSRGRT